MSRRPILHLPQRKSRTLDVLRMTAITAVVTLAVMVGFAFAASAQQVYVGVHGGKSMASTDITNGPSTFSLDGLGSQGYVGGVHGGVDIGMPKSAFFVGAFAGWDWQNTAFTVAPGNFKASMGDSWYVGARAGVVTHGTKIYVLSAYRQTDVATSVATLTIPKAKGFDLGLGIEVPLSNNVSLGLEGVRTQYQRDEITFGAPPVATGIHEQTDAVSIMARLNVGLNLSGNGSIFDDRAAPAKLGAACDPKMANCK